MIAFIKKEIMENYRTKKLLILIVVFLALGIMSPLFAKLTPEILKMVNIDASAINLSNPTAYESFEQFFKNISQIGIIVLAIVYCGIVANDLNRGTLINILTKGVKRSSVILSKFLVVSIIWIIAYSLSFIVCYIYTCYYFDISIVSNVFISVFALCIFGLLLLSFIILGGVLFKNTMGSLLTAFVFYGLLLILGIFKSIDSYNPSVLSSANMGLIKGQIEPSFIYPALIISIIIIVLNINISIQVFNKSEIK